MLENFFKLYPDFEIIETPLQALIDKYVDILPAELIDIWKTHGFGIYMDGYLKIVNPEIYQPILDEGYDTENNKEIVFAVTALGDFLVWVGDAVRLVDFRHGKYAIVSTSNFSRFFERRLADESFLSSEFKHENYIPAREKLGVLAYDECFGYVPILGAGGPEKVENLQKVKIREHISIIAQMMGRLS